MTEETNEKPTPRILHIGCGNHPLPDWMDWGVYTETRLDINTQVRADIYADMTDMGDIGPFDIIYSCHTLEHIYRHDVDKALQECRRVLRPGGMAIHIVPDLEDVKANNDVLYVSLSGPITGLDMIYGHGGCVEENKYMEHHGGFIQQTMTEAFEKAGFTTVKVLRGLGWNLVGMGIK